MTAERYTAVFTGLFNLKKPGEYPYLSMGDKPPDGGYALRRSRPPYERMGHEVFFGDLPEDWRRLVVDTYQDLWGLRDPEGAA